MTLLRIGDELREMIGLGVRDLHDAGDVANGHLPHHLTESDDVADATLTIFISTIFDNFVATSILDIGINIRHRDTVGVQEALKEQIVFQRVELGNPEGISENRTGSRTTTRAVDDTLTFAPVNKVLDD